MSTQTDLLSLLPPPIDVNICGDFSRSQASLVWLHRNLLKKFDNGLISRHAKQAALDKFLSNNASCNWAPDETSYYHDVVLLGRSILFTELTSADMCSYNVSLSGALDRLLPGPGSSLGTKHTDFVRKLFFSKVTTYDDMTWKFYSQSLGPTWKEAELLRLHQFGPASVVEGTKLNFARKDAGIARVINTEASIDMMFQKGLGLQIEDVLKRYYNIDLSTQPTVNRFLAKMGSMGWMQYATMDLRSYSDTISVDFCKFYIPPKVFQALSSVRSKVIELPKEFGGEKVELKMFSTMGNGFTFPLQTLILASLLKAVYMSLGLPTNCHDAPHFSVFGDDVIILNSVFYKVKKVFEYCGFQVNDDKSFCTGAFRESCGEDYFRGQNIRSVYLRKYSHDTDTYSLFNRLARWSIRNSCCLDDILSYLYGSAKSRLCVPFDEQDGSGFKMPEYFAAPRRNRHGLCAYKALRPKPRKFSYTIDYHDARLLVGALGGFAEGGRKVVKRDGVRYTTGLPSTTLRDPVGSQKMTYHRGSTSSWDFVPHKHLTSAHYLLIFAGLFTPKV